MRKKTINNEIKKIKGKLTMLCVYLKNLNQNVFQNLFNSKKEMNNVI